MVIEYSLYEVVGLSTYLVIRTTERSEGERRRARVAPPGHLSYLRMMIGMIKAVTDSPLEVHLKVLNTWEPWA